MQEIDRDEVRRLIAEEGAQVVEVLPAKEYEEEHLPGAVSLPLKELGNDAVGALDRSRPVIVYCYDYQCDMSPRAAWRLDSLGFARVYDYVAGKADWMAAGLPTEGASAGTRRITDIARGDVPRCELGETVSQVRERMAGWDVCVVVNERDVVLGIVRAEALALEDDRPVSAVMQEGPSTFRPNLGLVELAGHLRKRGLPRVLVTRSDGTLIGLVRLEDIPDEQAANDGS